MGRSTFGRNTSGGWLPPHGLLHGADKGDEILGRSAREDRVGGRKDMRIARDARTRSRAWRATTSSGVPSRSVPETEIPLAADRSGEGPPRFGQIVVPLRGGGDGLDQVGPEGVERPVQDQLTGDSRSCDTRSSRPARGSTGANLWMYGRSIAAKSAGEVISRP